MGDPPAKARPARAGVVPLDPLDGLEEALAIWSSGEVELRDAAR